MNRDEAKSILNKKLKDIKALDKPLDITEFRTVGSNLTSPIRLPYPYMIYLTLVDILDFQSIYKPMEKILWIIPIEYCGIPFLLGHGKFGLRIASNNPQQAEKLLPKLMMILNDSFKITNKVFAPIVNMKIGSGDVTIPNSFINLTNQYYFMRDHAIDSFNSPEPKPVVTSTDDKGNPRIYTTDPMKAQREGYYYSIAAIDAFFSRLEYILMVAYVFMKYIPGKNGLLDFLKLKWSDKYLQIFNFAAEAEANKVYDQLIEIKRTFRNKMAHGGLDYNGESFYIHFGSIGAIPARLCLGPDAEPFPISDIDFSDVCRGFDKCDEFFENGSMSTVWTYLKSGFDIACDERSVDKYRRYLCMNKDELDAELAAYSDYLDAMQNMDW